MEERMTERLELAISSELKSRLETVASARGVSAATIIRLGIELAITDTEIVLEGVADAE